MNYSVGKVPGNVMVCAVREFIVQIELLSVRGYMWFYNAITHGS